MCGIAGSVGRPIPVSVLQAALHHRGPDDCGAVQLDNVQLIHTRLAIVDVAGGVQPMRHGPLTISFNGEIYNHRQLRNEHRLPCKTDSDTETLLCLLAAYGEECLPMLDGMFALAVYDARDQSLFLARDRAGEKPLYLWQDPLASHCVFASELNALSAALPLEINHEALQDYLASGLFSGSQTAYRHVTALRPGSSLRINCHTGESNQTQWFSMAKQTAQSADKAITRQIDAIDSVDEALNIAVKRQLLSSDVPVGAFLSGGIDSGLVTAMAAHHTDLLNTFTVAFDGQFDESPLAQQVANRYGTRHEVLEVDYSSLPQHIESIICNYGTPTADDSIIPTWYVSRAARQHLKVVLTGDGADEQFAGYRRYVPYTHINLFGTDPQAGGRRSLLFAGLSKLADKLPNPAHKNSLYNYAWRLLQLAGEDGLQRYLATTTMADARLLGAESSLVFLKDRYATLAASPRSSLCKLMTMDFDTLLAGGLTTKMDIGAMAHSLEARSPFLSADILQLAPRLPDHFKIKGRTTKYLLRLLARRYLPEAVCRAPKRGFETPLVSWMDERLKAPVHDLLGPGSARVRDYCDAACIDALLDNSTSAVSPLQRARLLWLLYTAEVWLQRR